MANTQNSYEDTRYVSESDWESPSEKDLNDYLSGNLLTERPVSA